MLALRSDRSNGGSEADAAAELPRLALLMVGWPAITGILAGLWMGTDLGARIANGVSRSVLRLSMIALISLMAHYMTSKALS